MTPLAASRTAIVTMKLGYRMKLDLDCPVERAAHDARDYDSPIIEHCLAMIPPDAVILDIGANVGLYACAFGIRVAPRGGRVFAFEPVSTNFARLQENIALNALGGCIEPIATALGPQPGRLTLHVQPEAATNNAVGDNMLAPHDRAHVAKHRWKAEQVPVARLDDWAAAAGLDRCDLIKIDVEGADLLVLESGMELIRRTRPLIVAEFNPYWMLQIGRTMQDVLRAFSPLGYRCYRERGGEFLALTPELIAPPMETPTYLLRPEQDPT